MTPSLSIGPRTLLNDCNHSATAIFWRSAIVQAIIDDRVFEAGIWINPAHSFTQSMTTIPRMIVLRRQDSPEHDTQDDLTPTSGQLGSYLEKNDPR